MKKELQVIQVSKDFAEIPEILGNGIKVEEVSTIDFEKFLSEFSL